VLVGGRAARSVRVVAADRLTPHVAG
jgi:hypothetical protein